jgi:hypothetical protein
MLVLLAQQNFNGGGGGAGSMVAMCACPLLIFLGVFVVVGAIMWKVFTKAGQPGWAALVPIYNTWLLVTEICKKEPLWFILTLIPIANIVAAWVLCMELAKKFGKSDAFGIGLFFLSPIFLAMLAFGDARYQGGRGGSSRGDGYEDDYEDDRPRRRDRRDGDVDDYEDDRPRRGR